MMVAARALLAPAAGGGAFKLVAACGVASYSGRRTAGRTVYHCASTVRRGSNKRLAAALVFLW